MTDFPPPRSAEEIAHEWCQALLPPGPALNGSNIASLMLALAMPRETLEGDVSATGYELCPGTSRLLLDDYRTLLGPDPLGRDQGELTDREWHYVLQQRWTARGDQRPAFYFALAKSYGVSISIEEPDCPICGVPHCGDGSVVADETVNFTWIVELPKNSLEAICGDGYCGMMEASQDDKSGFAALMQVFRLLKPAHSEVYFRHDGVWVNE